MDRVPRRWQYIEELVDAALQDAQEMAQGFMAWCEHHAPIWREQGRDETWIRLRIASARATHALVLTLQRQRATPGQQRKVLREFYDHGIPGLPDLYALMLERSGLPVPDATVHGTTEDLQQRYTLRVLVAEAEKASREAHAQWANQPPPDIGEEEAVAQIRDLSTVEELELALGTCRFLTACFAERPRLAPEVIQQRLETWSIQARAEFIAKHGYAPEDSTTPFTPVTIHGPVDHDDYMAQARRDFTG